MSFKLKEGIEDFQVVDGAFEGRKFRKGFLYAEIPPEEAKKFEEVADDTAPAKTKTATKRGEEGKS
jgi:hypothetical protein